jgi:protoporphyrinogen/coproporphyrinogen III oxidase
LIRIAVIGGGVTGLTAAHRLRQLLPAAEVQLFEAGSRLGGALHTSHSGSLVLEQGADSFLTRDPVAIELCRGLGLGGELINTSAAHRRALVVCRGKLEPVPEGFVLMEPRSVGGLLQSPVLSWRGKLRALCEPLVRPAPDASRPDHDESVASFARRRLGVEAYQRLVQPLLAGIYVADAEQLSLAATMPEFLAAEREHGSLRAARRVKTSDDAGAHGDASPLPSPPHQGEGTGRDKDSGARYGAFMTLRSGVGALVDALIAVQPGHAIRSDTKVAAVHAGPERRWVVRTVHDQAEEFDGVIVTIPARQAASLFGLLDRGLSDLVGQIKAASSVVVTLVYGSDQIERPLDGFGFVVPAIENRRILAASFPSVKFAERHPPGVAPIRVFLGGALAPDMIGRGDDELVAIAAGELADLIGVRGAPRQTHVARWREAMPQYRVGHLQLVRQIESRVAVHDGLELAGASYRGVGIPQCIRSGREAAERLAAQLAAR